MGFTPRKEGRGEGENQESFPCKGRRWGQVGR